ncbi:class I adenylate-forming enzyme family protein [Salinactinospora qingdaonensis]|uniref:AMP-dependent synthetase/ligase domain-containing protein n=1 Tax=Salinactinospora qingdaonensis TaxID=702744 RepID=A0ABP7ER99_9ACTN
MSEFAATVLSPGQREKMSEDTTVGGGNLLASAIATNPAPATPFIHSARPLTTTDGERKHDFSLLQLDQLTQSWSAWYLEQGVAPRDRVAVWLEDSFAYSLHFYALAQIGAIAVLINSKAPEAIARSLIEQTGPVGLYTDRARAAILREGAGTPEELSWVQTEEELPAPAPAQLPDSARFGHVAEDPVVILHSSGTTGRPKPTIHTHRSIVSGPAFRLVDHKESPGALMMTALPQSHLGCIAYTVYAVLGGTPIVALRDCPGAELAEAVRRHRPTSVMSFAHGYAELAALDLEPGTLDSVDVWVSIGDAVHQSHMTRILSQRDPQRAPAAFFDRLGTTELGWGVLLKIRTLETERNDRCAGKPVGVADVAVLRKDGTPTQPGEVGLLGARGPAITAGYWNASDLTYRHRLAGYWLTGDMAYRDDNDDHYLVDRAVDTLETAEGPGYSVLMEELLLNEVPEIVDAAVVAGHRQGQQVPVAVVTTGDARAEPEKLLAKANEVLQGANQPRLALLEIAHTEADFPVGVTGKVLKRQLREKYDAVDSYLHNGDGKSLAVTF